MTRSGAASQPHRFVVNVGIFHDIWSHLYLQMPPRWGLDVCVDTYGYKLNEVPSGLKRAIWGMQLFVNRTRRGCKPRLPDLRANLAFFLKLTPMVQLQTAGTGSGEKSNYRIKY